MSLAPRQTVDARVVSLVSLVELNGRSGVRDAEPASRLRLKVEAEYAARRTPPK